MQGQEKEQAQEYLFALDIGTRSVIGIVGRMQHGVFAVLDTEYVEHDKRAMFDGQIEDIDQVAQISGLVKERLEARTGQRFDNVCVAAAGRALRTCCAAFTLELPSDEPVSSQTVYQLEMGAIGLAQDEVNRVEDGEDEPGLFCVGYSVSGYYLDDYRMTTILGHKGRSARVEVIATFLPNQVVDSLRSAMSLIGLNIINLTLEPIAAMNAVIPNELRLLNLALVDIGAGTSDIAVSDKGGVTAYTMATTAGDEITEYLMKRYLIDFATAERLKAAAGGSDEMIAYNDILSFAYSITRAELLEILRPPVEALAAEIAQRIVESNAGVSPVAVFLVGGGSKIPLLSTAVAQQLSLDVSKVAVGGSAYMKKQTSGELDVSDPEYATPLGIALTAAAYAEQNSMHVYVNDHKVQMLRSAGFTVMNALLMCGYKYPQLMGHSGKSVTFTCNGENIMVRGGLPKPAEITVNDKPASIATGLTTGDRIIIMPSVSGADAAPKVGDYATQPTEPFVTIDGIPYRFGELMLRNGKEARRDTPVEQDDVLQTLWLHTLGELCLYAGLMTEGRHFTVNGQPMPPDSLLQDGDVVVSADDDYEFPAVVPEPAPEFAFMVEPAPAPAPAPQRPDSAVTAPAPQRPDSGSMPPDPAPQRPDSALTAPAPAPSMTITLNRRSVELTAKEDKTPYLFLDMLNLVDIDPTKPEGDIVLRVNGQAASYLQEIHGGDDVQIYWSERGELSD